MQWKKDDNILNLPNRAIYKADICLTMAFRVFMNIYKFSQICLCFYSDKGLNMDLGSPVEWAIWKSLCNPLSNILTLGCFRINSLNANSTSHAHPRKHVKYCLSCCWVSLSKPPWSLASSSPSASEPCVPPKAALSSFAVFFRKEAFRGLSRQIWAVPPPRIQTKTHARL